MWVLDRRRYLEDKDILDVMDDVDSYVDILKFSF